MMMAWQAKSLADTNVSRAKRVFSSSSTAPRPQGASETAGVFLLQYVRLPEKLGDRLIYLMVIRLLDRLARDKHHIPSWLDKGVFQPDYLTH